MTDPRRDNLPDDLDPELDSILKALDETTDRLNPDAAFASGLERRLTASYSDTKVASLPFIKKIAPALLVILAVAALIVVVDWMIRSLAPPPVPAAGGTPAPHGTELFQPTLTMQPTAAPLTRTLKVYDWRGLSLSLAADLPDSPKQSDIYLAEAYPHATLEDVSALARRFAVEGAVYEARGELPGTTDYVVSDGKQTLRVRSEGYVEYIPDIVRAYNNLASVQRPDADQIIASFLESHGYTTPYRVQWSELRGAYMVEPLAIDGTALRYEYYSQPMMVVYLNQDGSILRLVASLLKLSDQPAAGVGIITAEEALQRLLDQDRTGGVLEAGSSAATPLHEWKRTFAVDQPLTIYGYVTSMKAVEAGQPSFIQLDGYPLTGETRGLDQMSAPSYVAAAGRFVEQDGVLRFSVDSWQLSQSQEDGLTGSLRRDNDQVILATDDGTQLVLPGVPADIPMPFENAFVVGTRLGDVFEWESIDDRSFGGGGGGGGGIGFYKLNLSGTPVPFPTASPTPVAAPEGAQYTVQSGDTLNKIAAAQGVDADKLMQANGLADPGQLMVGQVLIIPGATGLKVEGLRGMLNITITRQSDGSQLASYGFLPLKDGRYVLLEGNGLEQLQSHNSRPVDIWGTMQLPADGGIGTLQVERVEIPFPDLGVQVLQGKQKVIELQGQPATLLTADDGTTYVQLLQDGTTGPALIGTEGDEVQLECIAIPGETYTGYPALRVFGGLLAIDPKTGLHITLPVSMDKPVVLDMPDIGKTSPPEGAIIEEVELQHFVSDPRYAVPEPGTQPLYLQPVWRFAGHYSNGDPFEVLIQAAQDEFLLPELEPSVLPG
jgi:LysM repeat protein